MKPGAGSSRLHIGTCSWKYESWEGLVYNGYSAGVALMQYAQKFSSVEIDQWFWSAFPGKPPKLPLARTVEKYASEVPDTFRFSIKAPNSITLTHFYSSGGSKPDPNPHFLDIQLLNEFLHSLSPAKTKLGPIIFQFEYLNKQKMPGYQVFEGLLSEFFDSAPSGYQYAVEVRNPNYLTAGYFDFLRQKSVIPVFLHGYYMPSAIEVIGKYRKNIGNEILIRLHGPDRRGIEEASGGAWNSIIADRSAELRQFAALLNALLAEEVSIWLNVNNHYEGSAPLTISRIRALLEGQEV